MTPTGNWAAALEDKQHLVARLEGYVRGIEAWSQNKSGLLDYGAIQTDLRQAIATLKALAEPAQPRKATREQVVAAGAELGRRRLETTREDVEAALNAALAVAEATP